jgi:peptidyl-prolyl cis-trans isomerase SurA
MVTKNLKSKKTALLICLLILVFSGGCFGSAKKKREKEALVAEMAQKRNIKTVKKEVSYGKTVDKVVAKVNHEIITLSEIQEVSLPMLNEVREKYTGKEEKEKTKEIMKEYLNIYIENKLQVQWAELRGLTVPEKDLDAAVEDIKKKNGMTDKDLAELLKQEGITLEQYKKRIRDQILISKIVRMEVGSKILVTDEERQEYYNKHKQDFFRQGEIEIRQIMFLLSGSDDFQKKEKEAKAEEVLKKLREGADFAEMAKTYSEGPMAKNGGYLGNFKIGEITKEIETAAFKLKEGEISDIIRTDQGLHIIKVEKKIENAPEPYEEVKEKIGDIIFREKMEEKHKEWLKEIRQKAAIEIYL